MSRILKVFKWEGSLKTSNSTLILEVSIMELRCMKEGWMLSVASDRALPPVSSLCI